MYMRWRSGYGPMCHPAYLDDLIGAGTIGLIQAVDRFSAIPRTASRKYAKHRIRGAMLDFLREERPALANERRRTRTANATAEWLCPRQ